MTRFAYLAALLVSIGGLAVIDRKLRLAFWADARRAGLTVGLGVLGFLGWDLLGLGLHIFARGTSPHMTGLLLAPELPVEEAFFLTLLCYVALLAWRWFDRGARARASWQEPEGEGRSDQPGERVDARDDDARARRRTVTRPDDEGVAP